MSHQVHGITWFEAEGEVSRGWVWEWARLRLDSPTLAIKKQIKIRLTTRPDAPHNPRDWPPLVPFERKDPCPCVDPELDFETPLMLERRRFRAILLRFFSNDWHGVEALQLLDSGAWP